MCSELSKKFKVFSKKCHYSQMTVSELYKNQPPHLISVTCFTFPHIFFIL